MNQQERRQYLLQVLLSEDAAYQHTALPDSETEQKRLLRGLMNVRRPKPIDQAFLQVQDAYLQEETAAKGIVDVQTLTPVQEGI